MAKLPISKKPIVLVIWEDSAQPTGAWQWMDEIPPPVAVICHTVGHLVAESIAAVSLACSLGDVGMDRLQANGVMRIPRSAIRSIVRLSISSSRAAPREPSLMRPAVSPV